MLKKGGVPLFEREWFRSIQLNWQSIKAIQVTPKATPCSVKDNVEHVLAKYVQVFQDGIGTLKHIKAGLCLQMSDGRIPDNKYASAATLWQRALDQVLQGVTGTQCYLDDIIVTGHDDGTIWRT